MYSVIGSDGHVYGPVDVDTLRSWYSQGRVTANTNLIDAITGRILPARDAPELAQNILPVAPPTPPPSHPHSAAMHGVHVHNYIGGAPTSYAYAVNPPKSKIGAGLFALFLGCFGIHRFYLGYAGALQISDPA